MTLNEELSPIFIELSSCMSDSSTSIVEPSDFLLNLLL